MGCSGSVSLCACRVGVAAAAPVDGALLDLQQLVQHARQRLHHGHAAPPDAVRLGRLCHAHRNSYMQVVLVITGVFLSEKYSRKLA